MKKLSIAILLLSFLGIGQIASALHLPRGNYYASCRRCHFNRNYVLSCTCQTQNGFYKRTALRVGRRCDYIQNSNGHLVCTARNHRHPSRRRKPRKVVVNAGPIFNQAQANVRCPSVCRHYRRWDGQWWTIRSRMTSVCECIR